MLHWLGRARGQKERAFEVCLTSTPTTTTAY